MFLESDGCRGSPGLWPLTGVGPTDSSLSLCQKMFNRLSKNLQNNDLQVTGVIQPTQPTSSQSNTKVTLNLPASATEKLSQLVGAGEDVLRELGILSLQVEGGQVVSMTVAGESDSEDVRTQSSKHKSSPAKEEKHVTGNSIKQETGQESPVSIQKQIASGHTSFSGLPLGSLMSQSTTASDNLAALIKNHSSFSRLSPAEQSVLQNYMSTMSSSHGYLSKDNGEPVNKKPRKQETSDGDSRVIPSPSKHSNISPSKSKMDNSGNSGMSGAIINSKFPYKKDGGFSLVPVNNCTSGSGAAGGRSHGTLHHNNTGTQDKSTSPSALRIASLPGVSLTAVSSSSCRNNTQSPSGPGLMPPPPPTSAVTLSPVPRSSSSSSSSSSTSTETGDKSSSVSSSKLSLNSDNNISGLSQSLDSRPPLLINPVTGQFEAGPRDIVAASESENDQSKNDPSSDSDIMEEDGDNEDNLLRHQSTKSGSQSPANSTSEPSLKVKLKVSSTPVNNSSKNLLAPKNDMMLKSGSGSSSNNSKSVENATEPKVPKLKIRLGKDKNAVKLKNDVENHDTTNDLDDNFSPNSQNDLKPKIKIKPLTGSPGQTNNSDTDSPNSSHSSITSPYFPNLANNIVNHASIEERKKKKDKMKDRSSVWLESLAKHQQRSEDGTKEDKVKETKSWPEVLEARLHGSSNYHTNNSNSSTPSPDHPGSLSFSKYDSVLETQTEKGEDQASVKSEGDDVVEGGGGTEAPVASDTGTSHSGGTQAGHLNYLGPGGRDLPGPGHTPTSPPQPAQDRPASSLNTVLDILEGRPSLGQDCPMSPDCPPHRGSQQGEDSGIESMDSRSEKSPNQGESPFHGSTESEMGRTPTYSSSMSSGKMSPPVSELVSDTPTTPGHSSDTVSPHSSGSVQSSVSHSQALNKNSFLEESHKSTVTITGKTEDVNDTNSGNDLNEAKSNGEASTKTENSEPFENTKNDVKSEEVLLRSCDGADDPKMNVQESVECSDKAVAAEDEITRCMHDYASNNTTNSTPAAETTDHVQTLFSQKRLETSKTTIAPTSAPVVTTVNIAGNSIAVRPAHHVPPGMRMVPVKLVTVPGVGSGNVRMLRVSPVKSLPVSPAGVLPPRTVVIKSSVLKAVSSQDLMDGSGSDGNTGTASLVRFPVPSSGSDNCDSVTPSQSLSSIVASSSSTSSSTLLKKSQSVSLTPVEVNSCSLDPVNNTKAAPVTFQKRDSVEDNNSNNTSCPLTVDTLVTRSDSEQMPSPAQKKAAQSKCPTSKCNGDVLADALVGDLEDEISNAPGSPKIKGNKKSASGQDLLKNEADGESLLRPLLAKSEEQGAEAVVQPSSPSPASPLPESPSVLSLPLINPRKRTRRDTGSSVTSVTSVDSNKSVELTSSKRLRATSPVSRRKSQSTERSTSNKSETESKSEAAEKVSAADNKSKTSKSKTEIGNGLPQADSNVPKKPKSAERTKGRPTLVKNANNVNIKTTESKKPSPKKAAETVKKVGKQKPSDHPQNSSSSLVVAASEKVSSLTSISTKVDTSGRRVSTRSKKPDESGGATTAAVTKRR